mmetsp:Transcript_95815/g.309355  ORF Transcript_95815/g.309355 Transcript_95815/m.309355 type:complete len:234 (-) Transcript_95815:476-1177(-)
MAASTNLSFAPWQSQCASCASRAASSGLPLAMASWLRRSSACTTSFVSPSSWKICRASLKQLSASANSPPQWQTVPMTSRATPSPLRSPKALKSSAASVAACRASSYSRSAACTWTSTWSRNRAWPLLSSSSSRSRSAPSAARRASAWSLPSRWICATLCSMLASHLASPSSLMSSSADSALASALACSPPAARRCARASSAAAWPLVKPAVRKPASASSARDRAFSSSPLSA